nr:sigma-70 family RNA polymerase sigma factor [uncultured Acetatifactor sp.]
MEKQKADQIITEYFQKIYGFAIKKCYSYEDAEELCAQIVQNVYLSLRKVEEIFNVEGYVWRISQNTYAKYVAVRKRQEGISIDGMDGLEIPCYDTYDLGEAEEEIRLLNREVAFLTEKRRRIVYLFYYEDRSVSGIAREMNLPEGTVKWHLNKARNELKEGLSMERKIGKLGLSPVRALDISHNGNPGSEGGPEAYLGDKMNLNIVYSVYHTPRTMEGIAEELGITPVFLEDRIHLLEDNGFLMRTAGNRYTTFVKFSPREYSLELQENKLKLQLRIAEELVKEYVPLVREAVRDVKDVYIPGGNRQLLEAAAVFYGITNKCALRNGKDLSKYRIRTTAGGDYIAMVNLYARPSDPDYVPTLKQAPCWAGGDMWRYSVKYPTVSCWSVDSSYSSREGTWQNNLNSDYEALYEYVTGAIEDNAANSDKIQRLRDRRFLDKDNNIGIVVVKGSEEEFFERIPELDAACKSRYADMALEYAMNESKGYPPQMQDLVLCQEAEAFIGSACALRAMEILYGDGTFRPLTDREKVAANLLMFSDVLPT